MIRWLMVTRYYTRRGSHYQIVLAFICLRNKKNTEWSRSASSMTFSTPVPATRKPASGKLTRRHAHFPSLRVPRFALPCPLYLDVNLARTPRPVHRKTRSSRAPVSPQLTAQFRATSVECDAIPSRPRDDYTAPAWHGVAWRVYAKPSGDAPFNSGTHPQLFCPILKWPRTDRCYFPTRVTTRTWNISLFPSCRTITAR